MPSGESCATIGRPSWRAWTRALAAADEQLDLVQRKVDETQGSGREFIAAHRLILRSPELAGEARRLIECECFAAEWAVSQAIERIRLTFSRLQDPYFRDRGGDFDIVAERLLRVLLGLPELRPGRARLAAASL